MPITTLFLDVDDTLYPSSAGLWAAIRARMEDYMRERLHLSSQDIPRLRQVFFETYGTTLRGLQATQAVDVKEYLNYVHDLPVGDYLCPDPELRRALLACPQRKLLFTNADREHAKRVMAALQVTECIDGIVDIYDFDPYCKPQPQAYAVALRAAGVQEASQCVLCDDSLRNLDTAHSLGFHTVLVGSDRPHPSAEASISKLSDLPGVLQRLGRE